MIENNYTYNLRLISQFLNTLNAEKAVSKNTLSAYKTDMQIFAQKIKKKIDLVNREEIENYIKNLLNAGTKKQSLARKISVFKSFYKFLHIEGIIKLNTYQFLQPPKKEQTIPQFLTQDIIRDIYKNEKNTMLQAYILFDILYSCGLRISEAINLTNNDIRSDNNNGKYIIVKGKGSKERIIPLPKSTENIISKFITKNIINNTANIKNFIFFNNKNKKPITRQFAYKIIKKFLSNYTTNNNISPHTIRHTYAVHLLENGMDIRIIQDLLGHAQLETTQIYTKTNNKIIKNTINKTHPLS